MNPLHAPSLRIGLLLIVAGLPGRTADIQSPASVMTVSGSIPVERMGTTLPHEHVMVDFAGAAAVSPGRYDRGEVFKTVLPHLRRVRALGLQTLVEATPAYVGRDPVLLRQLSEASGISLLVSTGYYGAGEDRYLPRHAFAESADSLAARWIREWNEGIEGSGIRPGFIKIGVDTGALSPIDRKLVRAAARAHLRTGLTIAAHTGPAPGAVDELAVLKAEGVDPSAWIWVHAQVEEDSTLHVRAARSGAWVSFDGLAPDNVDHYVALVSFMKAEGLLHRVLVSHDAGWYHVGEPGGGTFRPYDTLFTDFLPALTAAGFTDAEIHQLTVTNPAAAFAIRVRARAP